MLDVQQKDIDFPVVGQPNILVCLTEEAYNSFGPEIRPARILLTVGRFVEPTKKVDARQIELPMYERVIAEVGKPIVFNICVLGTLIGISDIVQPESVMKVIGERVPKDFIEMNHSALDIVIEPGRALKL